MQEVIKTNSETYDEFHVRLATCMRQPVPPLEVAGVLGTCIRLRKKLKTLNRRMQRIKHNNKVLQAENQLLLSEIELLRHEIVLLKLSTTTEITVQMPEIKL